MDSTCWICYCEGFGVTTGAVGVEPFPFPLDGLSIDGCVPPPIPPGGKVGLEGGKLGAELLQDLLDFLDPV